MTCRIVEKLAILADAAKYDVSCSSSGSKRKNPERGLGTTGNGICHAYTEDGRCVSLLKILLTNHCIYNCAYCVSRSSNDIKRAAFTVQEVVDLTINFYRRNYIEGLFLSSGIFKNADYTMERLVMIARKLRQEHRFNGYIHLKTIPGCSEELVQQAGLYADRLSINLEMPSERSLQLLAPEKNRKDMITPMKFARRAIEENREERQKSRKVAAFAPAGQSTQLIIGASPETDLQIMSLSEKFYREMKLKRVYYSGYVPISEDKRLPSIGTPVPMIRENRLYQADWLIRFYGFRVDELLQPLRPDLDLQVDPKLSWALYNRHMFPVDINRAERELILRVPGIGLRSANRICQARRFGTVRWEHLQKFGIATNRAQHFIVCPGMQVTASDQGSEVLRTTIIGAGVSKYSGNFSAQLSLFQ